LTDQDLLVAATITDNVIEAGPPSSWSGSAWTACSAGPGPTRSPLRRLLGVRIWTRAGPMCTPCTPCTKLASMRPCL